MSLLLYYLILNKSEVVLVEDVGGLGKLADILSCKIGRLPMNYLGMPLGSSFSRLQ